MQEHPTSRTDASSADQEEIRDLVSALVTASRALVGISARSMAGLDGAVTLTQFRTLVVLASHGSTGLRRLADRLGVTSSTTLRILDRLIAGGFATRTSNENDRREVVIELTPAGRRLVDEVTRRRSQEIEKIVSGIDPEQRAEMIEALLAFAAAADEPLVTEISALSW